MNICTNTQFFLRLFCSPPPGRRQYLSSFWLLATGRTLESLFTSHCLCVFTFMFFYTFGPWGFVLVNCNLDNGRWRPCLDHVQIFLGLFTCGYKWSQFNGHIFSLMTHNSIAVSWKPCSSCPIHHSFISFWREWGHFQHGGGHLTCAYEPVVWTISSAAVECLNTSFLFFHFPLLYLQAPLSHLHTSGAKDTCYMIEIHPPLYYVEGWLK